MNRSLFGLLIVLALTVSACGSPTPANNPNDTLPGTSATSETGLAMPTDTTGGTSPTLDTGATVPTDTTGDTMPTDTMDSTMTADPNATSAVVGDDDSRGDIAYVLNNDSRFTMLASAVTAAQLEDTLRNGGPFTVFAPTDDAFAALPAGQLETLLANPTALINLLQYHVVSGDMSISEISDMASLATLNNQSIMVTEGTNGGDEVMLNGTTRLVTTDITTTNGVIHVIDTVLIPTS